MIRTYQFDGIPILSWADGIEQGAMDQAVNLSRLPFAYRHIALMADVHQGYGMPIGGVLAADGMVIPNAVGVDIGCGVTAAQTDIRELSIKAIQNIIRRTSQIIPVGFKHHKQPQAWSGFDQMPKSSVLQAERESAMFQLGTLGGGNHFISIEQGDDEYIWLMVHSGSRNLGKKVADFYNRSAKKENDRREYVPRKYNLAPLPVDSKIGEEYLHAMNFCLHFARENRNRLFDAFFQVFSDISGSKEVLQRFDIHHNYAVAETHYSKSVMLHRKGATHAGKGTLGVIPGSMGTPSYIVKGLGNPESFTSCSHGAGRVISRKQANKQFTKKEANQAMGSIVFQGWGNDLSEAPMAYKDIEAVIENQRDLIQPLVKLRPLGVMKG